MESLNTSFISEISQVSNKNYSTIQQQRSKTPSKISIHNIYINKKVQIGKNFSKLKLDHNKNKPNTPLIPNSRKINRNNFTNNSIINKSNNSSYINPPSGKSAKLKILNRKKFPKISSESTLNNTGNNSRENSEKNKIKKITKSKSKDYSIDNRKLSIMDIPSINEINLYNNNYKQKTYDDFYFILSKSNVLPFNLRILFAKISNKNYSKEEILNDYKNYLQYKRQVYENEEKEFLPFKPSKTIQCLLGFLNKNDENEFIKNHITYNSNNENEIILYNIFKILYILVNKKIPDNNCDIIKNFFQKVYKELNINNLKQCILNKICNNLTLSKIELNTINMILNNNGKIIDNDYLKSIENEKIMFPIALFVKELNDYSKKRFKFGNLMILYLHEKMELKMTK